MPRRSEDDSELARQRLSTLARRLKQLRTWRGLTQKDLATRAGLSSDYVARLEQGRVTPGLMRLWEIADALEIPLSDLFNEGLPTAWRHGRPARPPAG